MLQAGYVFCHRCGHATQNAYYFDSETNTWVQLFRTMKGKFVVARYIPNYMQGKIAKSEADKMKTYRFSPTNTNDTRGLQHTITVECYEGNKMYIRQFVRSCPFCVGQQEGWNSAMELIPHLGDLPTYVIGVVGARTVGKSCWIHALSCPTNINKTVAAEHNAAGGVGYFLDTSEYSRESSTVIRATELNDLGKTRMMYIQKSTAKNKTEAVAQVLVLDFAGELFAEGKKEEFESGAAHIFRGGEGYSGVDAVVFMTDPLPEQEGYSLTTTYERAKGDYDLLKNKPIAFVMNKADMLIDDPPVYHINADETLPTVRLLDASTFAYQGGEMYRKSFLQSRIALQTHLLKRINPLVQAVSRGTRCAGFLVKSTEPFVVKDEKTQAEDQLLNFGVSMNVMDPLLWVLNELDIFPIED